MKGLNKGLIRQGLGEIFKIAVIKSEELFNLLSKNLSRLEDINFYQENTGIDVLKRSINLMLEELHNNPREDNLMRCVDYGHSFSPLVEMESLSRKGFKSLPHGYAVAYDCILTATIANYRNKLSDTDFKAIFKLFSNINFDLSNEIYKDHNLLWASFMEMKKHRGGNQNLPIPVSLGSYEFIQDVSYEEMKQCVFKINSLIKLIDSV
jgi:3-dehydroquinate synthase